MAYVGKPFDHDIFVSYSHGDADGTGESKLKKWSQAFARELESELKTNEKYAAVSIFLDETQRPAQGIDPLSPLTDQLQAGSGAAAILTILMSPQYLLSTYCANERTWWSEKQTALGLPINDRIAVARILPTQAPWPPPLSDGGSNPAATGFWFFDRSPAVLEPRPFEWPFPTPDSRGPFREEILRLVGWLRVHLEATRARLEERQKRNENVERLGAATGQTVYLHGRADKAKAWDRAFEALSSSGLAVLPTEPDPLAADPEGVQQRRRQRVEIMSECDALLLVATDDGPAADADLVVVGRQDRNSARASQKRPLLPCALLDTAGAVIATPNRKTTARNLSVQWIDTTSEPWTPAVQQWLHDAAVSESQK